jgi:hypothetical protein
VVGATGELGERICRLLRRWTPSVRVVGANRSGRGHPDFPVHRVDVHDERSLAPALRGVALVVNAVGPYLYDPAPLVRACVRARAHLVDLAEDVGWLRAAADAARRAGAEAAGVAVVPGCSTVPGLVALLAQRFAARGEVAEVAALLSLGSANPPSRGLLAGLLAPLGRRMPQGGRCFDALARAEASDGRRLVGGRWPAAVPQAGLRVGARRVPLGFWVGFDRRALVLALRVAAPVLGRLPARWISALAGGLLPLARAVRRLGTPRGVLLLRALDSAGAELARIEVAARANGLDVPAAPVVWIVECLLAGGLAGGGVLGLEELVTPSAALDWLREAGYEVRET